MGGVEFQDRCRKPIEIYPMICHEMGQNVRIFTMALTI
jgi:hypothetical protein